MLCFVVADPLCRSRHFCSSFCCCALGCSLLMWCICFWHYFLAGHYNYLTMATKWPFDERTLAALTKSHNIFGQLRNWHDNIHSKSFRTNIWCVVCLDRPVPDSDVVGPKWNKKNKNKKLLCWIHVVKLGKNW